MRAELLRRTLVQGVGGMTIHITWAGVFEAIGVVTVVGVALYVIVGLIMLLWFFR